MLKLWPGLVRPRAMFIGSIPADLRVRFRPTKASQVLGASRIPALAKAPLL